MKKNGFTLIEIIAVIVIIGIVMLIAVPAVINYTRNSNQSVYANNIGSFMEQAKLLYGEKQYGPYMDEDEIMLVPISVIETTKGDNKRSPYGSFINEQSYIIIERKGKTVYYYASAVDTMSWGLVTKREDEINNDVIEKISSTEIYPINSLYNCSADNYVLKTSTIYNFKGTNYSPVEYRPYGENKCSKQLPIIVLGKRS